MLYTILKRLIQFGMNLYYAEIKVNNRAFLDHDGPMIIIANHPNTLIDAWLIGTASPKPIYYMTKATFFDSKWKMKILRSLNMIPVNRSTEAKTSGVNNQQTLEECYKVLAEGKTLVVFPEGNSFMELVLRQLKSGTARIALDAENRNDGQLNLKVVPVGLLYTEGNKFRSSILVNCGEGIGVTEYLDSYRENSILTAKSLTEKFRSLLEGVLVSTQTKEQEELVMSFNNALQSRYLDNAGDVESEVDLLRKIRDRVEFLSLQNPKRLEQAKKILLQLNWKTEILEIQNDFLDRGIRSGMFIRQIITSIIGILLGLPFFIFGLIHNIIPFRLTDLIIPKITSSKEFYAPLAILIGFVLYPINYCAWLLLAFYTLNFDWFSLMLYFLLMPILGMFAYGFAKYLTHTWSKLIFIGLIIKKRETIVRMQMQRKRLFQLLFEE